MDAKNLVAGALLLFVAASVAILVGREMRESTADDAAPAAEQLPDNALVVYYFHGDARCPTCRNIESYSHDAVQAAFADELAEKKVLWKVVNYEQPEHSHLATDYEIVSPIHVDVGDMRLGKRLRKPRSMHAPMPLAPNPADIFQAPRRS